MYIGLRYAKHVCSHGHASLRPETYTHSHLLISDPLAIAISRPGLENSRERGDGAGPELDNYHFL